MWSSAVLFVFKKWIGLGESMVAVPDVGSDE